MVSKEHTSKAPESEINFSDNRLTPIVYIHPDGTHSEMDFVPVGKECNAHIAEAISIAADELRVKLAETSVKTIQKEYGEVKGTGRKGSDRRPSRQISEIHNSTLKTLSRNISVLEGDVLAPLFVKIDENKIESVAVSSPSMDESRIIWAPLQKFVCGKNTNPNDVSMLFEAYQLAKLGTLDDDDSSKSTKYWEKYDAWANSAIDPNRRKEIGDAMRAIRIAAAMSGPQG